MEENVFSSVPDFLNDDRFILWRLYKTKELDDYWTNYLAANPHRRDLLHKACVRFEKVRLNKIPLDATEKTEIFENIWRLIYSRQRIRRRRMIYWTSAAACSALIALSAVFFTYFGKTHTPLAHEQIIGKTLPDENVQLVVGNDVIELEPNSSVEVLNKGEVLLVPGKSWKKKVPLSHNKPNKLIVPHGKRSFITLPDGTKIWLNSGTELDFPTGFAHSSRDVKVNGEIYIEVAKSDKPFLVHTPKAVIRVPGTKFNVAAYGDDLAESVVLVEGSVRVTANGQNAVMLSPNELATVSAGEIVKIPVDVSRYISWRKGFLEFEKTSMEEVLQKVGRYYNISFEKNPNVALNAKTVSGKLHLFNDIDSVMTAVSVLSGTDYKRENNTILIQKKQ